jgi:hypothetical protein
MLNKTTITKISAVVLTVTLLIPPTLSFAQGRGRHDGREYYHYRDRPTFGLRVSFLPDDAFAVRTGGMTYYYYDGVYYNRTGPNYVIIDPPMGAIVSSLPYEYRLVNINGVNYYTDNGIFYVYTNYGYQVVPPPMMQTVTHRVITAQPVEMIEEPQNQTKVGEGMGLGGIFGALLGGIIGHQNGHHELGGALIGGVAGAAAGGIVGAQMPNENYSAPVVVQPSVVTALPVATMPPTTIDQGTPDGSYTVNIANPQGGYIAVIIKKSGNGFVGPQGEYYPEFPKVAQLQAMYGK